jgi:hypothetical protein
VQFALLLAKGKIMGMGKDTNPNSTAGIPAKGVVVPKNVGKADMSGERMGRVVGGVAMGKEDAMGSDKEFNTGRTAGVCYEHNRTMYSKEDKSQR